MRYELYAVEVRVSCNPEAYDLVRRENEDGVGSPLTWKTHNDAEKYIERIQREIGDDDPAGAQVVVLTGGTEHVDEAALTFEDLILGRYDSPEPA